MAAQIKVPTRCAVEWVGNIRSLDSYTIFDCIIVAGREQPPVESVEDMVRALFADGPLPELSGILSDSIRGYRICNCGRRGVKVAVHPDHRVQTLLEQIRERGERIGNRSTSARPPVSAGTCGHPIESCARHHR